MNPVIGITVNINDERDFWVRRLFSERIGSAGGIPILLPCTISAEDAISVCRGILFTGGGDVLPEHYGVSKYDSAQLSNPSAERDDFELHLARLAYEHNVPTLGICRGEQVLNAALGGTLHLHIDGHRQSEDRPVTTHSVHIMPGTILRNIVGSDTTSVNSFHHQAVDRVAGCLNKAAVSHDGITEAIEDPAKRFFIGVQWHPEFLATDAAEALFAAFVAACK